jgi:hypothetical protein
LEGYHASHKKLPERSKIKKKYILWAIGAASSSFELLDPLPPPLSASSPAKVSKPPKQIIVFIFITFFKYLGQ